MATKKTQWPKVIVGSHSVRTEYEDGRVEFESDWEKLKRDVMTALMEYAIETKKSVPAKTEKKPAKPKAEKKTADKKPAAKKTTKTKGKK